MLRCVPISYTLVESHATDPSFDQEDAEDPEHASHPEISNFRM
jgi:hypothetical protein